MSAESLKLLSSGASKAGATIDSTGTFLDFETTYLTKASYLSGYNRDTSYALLINFNTSAKDTTAANNKTIVIPPNAPFEIDDENISNATLFRDSGESGAADYVMGKRNHTYTI